MTQYTEPNLRTSALVTIDTQCDTLDGQPFEIPGTSSILPNMKKLAEAYRMSRMPIVHIVRIYRADGSNVDMCRKEAFLNGQKLLLEGSAGCDPAPGLFNEKVALNPALLLRGNPQIIGDREIILYKPRWGAFYKTSLESHLNHLGVDSLVFTGCNFPNCPRTSIYEASERDFKLVLVDDAVSGLYDQGVEEMRRIGVKVINTETLVRAIEETKPK